MSLLSSLCFFPCIALGNLQHAHEINLERIYLFVLAFCFLNQQAQKNKPVFYQKYKPAF